MTTLSRRDAVVVMIVVAIAAVTWLPRLRGPIDLRWDGAAYYELGTSLAEGKGLRLLHEPGAIQTTLHAPMVPVIVAIHQLALGTSDVIVVGRWLRYSYFVLFIAYAIAAYLLARQFLPRGYAIAVVVIVVCQFHTIFISDLCFAEIPFALVTVLFTLCTVAGSDRSRRPFRLPLAIVAFALRTVGVALLAAWILESVCGRRYRQGAWRLGISLAVFTSWTGYVAHVESSEEYRRPAYEYQRADYVYINVSYARNMRYRDPSRPELGYATGGDRAAQWLANVARMPLLIGETLSTRQEIWDLLRATINRRAGYSVMPSPVVPMILLVLAGFVAIGLGRLWVAGQWFIPLYVSSFLAFIAVTPVPGQFNRYVSPLGPLLAISMFLGVRESATRLGAIVPGKASTVHVLAAASVIAWIAVGQAHALRMLFTQLHDDAVAYTADGEAITYRLFFYDGLSRATDAALDWLKGHATDSDIVAATVPPWSYLRTGRKSVLPPLEIDAVEAQRLLESVPVSFLVVDNGDFARYTTAVVTTFPERWRQVYASAATHGEGRVVIYQRTGRQD